MEITNIQMAVELMRMEEVLERMCRVRRDHSLEQNTQEHRKSVIFPIDPEFALSP